MWQPSIRPQCATVPYFPLILSPPTTPPRPFQPWLPTPMQKSHNAMSLLYLSVVVHLGLFFQNHGGDKNLSTSLDNRLYQENNFWKYASDAFT